MEGNYFMKSANKWALVTGASRGLGLGVAAELCKLGFQTILVGREPGLGQAGEKLSSDGFRNFHLLNCDVTNEAELLRVAIETAKLTSHLDILINNAGIFLDAGTNREQDPSFENVKPEVVLKTFVVNTLAPYVLTQALLPLLKKAPAARIVNVSSGMGGINEMGPGYPAYRMSKAALNALTKNLSQEFKNSPIKINSVCPGWVRTAMGGPQATRDLPEGVASILWAALLAEDGPTGGYFRDGKPLAW
jgi:NAD(P)-dependent dehydrogenase (short-subunit alcohol dehydrogenase family)